MSRQAGRATGNNGRDCASLEPSRGRQENTTVSEEQTPYPASSNTQGSGPLGPLPSKTFSRLKTPWTL